MNFNNCFLLGMPGPLEILVILIVLLVLFGANKVPEIGRHLGKGLREFKKAMNSEETDEENKKD